MRINQNKIIGIVAVTLGTTLFALNSGAVHADILPTATSPNPTVTVGPGGTFFYSYDLFVTSAQQIKTGDFFTIYDFNGLLGATPAPAGWTFAAQSTTAINLGNTGIFIVPGFDDPTIKNATFQYAGPTIPGESGLGVFTLESTFGPGGLLNFAGSGTTQSTVPSLNNLNNSNFTTVQGPGVVPEPGEFAFAGFMGAGLIGLVVRARRSGSGSTLKLQNATASV